MNSEYSKGYNRAIMDVCRLLNNAQSSMKHWHKDMSYNSAMQVLAFIMKNREELCSGNGKLIEYNPKKDGFEFTGGGSNG